MAHPLDTQPEPPYLYCVNLNQTQSTMNKELDRSRYQAHLDYDMLKLSGIEGRLLDIYSHINSLYPDLSDHINSTDGSFYRAVASASRNTAIKSLISYLQYGGDRDKALSVIDRILS